MIALYFGFENELKFYNLGPGLPVENKEYSAIWDYFFEQAFPVIWDYFFEHAWVKIFRINPEIRILRLTFHRKADFP